MAAIARPKGTLRGRPPPTCRGDGDGTSAQSGRRAAAGPRPGRRASGSPAIDKETDHDCPRSGLLALAGILTALAIAGGVAEAAPNRGAATTSAPPPAVRRDYRQADPAAGRVRATPGTPGPEQEVVRDRRPRIAARSRGSVRQRDR